MLTFEQWQGRITGSKYCLNFNESILTKLELLEEYYYMSNFKMVAPYCGVSRYDKNFFVYYLNTDENLRREYVFNTDVDANNFNA